jgi:hypothetical protein
MGIILSKSIFQPGELQSTDRARIERLATPKSLASIDLQEPSLAVHFRKTRPRQEEPWLILDAVSQNGLPSEIEAPVAG